MANNLIYIVLDSCRYDSFLRSQALNMLELGNLQKRYSYASWTSPSHQTILMGLVAHKSEKHVVASDVYKSEFSKWVTRLEIPDLSFKSFLPYLSLPKMLKENNYTTIARVSMPVLNRFTSASNFFDDYELMPSHNDFKGMIDIVEFEDDALKFYFFNLGETHYPYMLTGEDLPLISGVHGVFKRMDEFLLHGNPPDAISDQFFDPIQMARLHEQQSVCVDYVDSLMAELFNKCPSNTYFIVTADHGELFGEEGYFGHGPIMHPKCFEVPFIEGICP